ncbi:MAG: CBM9 family sugar-binding protein [Kiritimatiellae bacterium]|nr:CBM9 family sugar-binding protein [Kiritimatiellia bacterium]
MKAPIDQLDRLVEALNGGRVREDEGRLLLQTAMQLNAADRATVKVINPLTRPLTAKMSVGASAYDVTLKGGEERSLEVALPEKVRSDAFGKVHVPVTFEFEGRSYDETFEAAAVAVPYAAGEKPDWSKVPSVKMPRFIKYDKNSAHPGRGESFDADVKFAWNEKHLFLRFEVTDDRFCFVENETADKWGGHWNWDAIQLFFDSFGNAGEAARRGVFGHDYDDFSYELYPASPTNAVCFRRFAPDHQLTGGAGYGFVGNRLEPGVKVAFEGRDGRLVYDVDFPAHYIMPLKLEAGKVSPGLGIEIYDRDDPKVGSPVKISDVIESSDGRRDAMNNPHLYPQLIFVR